MLDATQGSGVVEVRAKQASLVRPRIATLTRGVNQVEPPIRGDLEDAPTAGVDHPDQKSPRLAGHGSLNEFGVHDFTSFVSS
jgi:hypothetical protein